MGEPLQLQTSITPADIPSVLNKKRGTVQISNKEQRRNILHIILTAGEGENSDIGSITDQTEVVTGGRKGQRSKNLISEATMKTGDTERTRLGVSMPNTKIAAQRQRSSVAES